jgi:hypothetical protein
VFGYAGRACESGDGLKRRPYGSPRSSPTGVQSTPLSDVKRVPTPSAVIIVGVGSSNDLNIPSCLSPLTTTTARICAGKRKASL